MIVTGSVLAFLTALVATIINGNIIGYMLSLSSCYSPKYNAVYGDSDDVLAAYQCGVLNDDYNALTNSPNSNDNSCDCISSQSSSCKYSSQMGCWGVSVLNVDYSCYKTFQLNYSYSTCDDIIGNSNVYYIRMLTASTVLAAFITFIMFIILIISSRALCDIDNKYSNVNNDKNEKLITSHDGEYL